MKRDLSDFTWKHSLNSSVDPSNGHDKTRDHLEKTYTPYDRPTVDGLSSLALTNWGTTHLLPF